MYTASRNGSIQQQKHLIFSWRKYGERHIILGMLLLSFLSMMGYTSSGHQINIRKVIFIFPLFLAQGILYTEKKFGWTVTQYTDYKMFMVKCISYFYVLI